MTPGAIRAETHRAYDPGFDIVRSGLRVRLSVIALVSFIPITMERYAVYYTSQGTWNGRGRCGNFRHRSLQRTVVV